MTKFRYSCYFLVLCLCCCKKPYSPKVISSPASYLVVEGIINSGNDSTIIKLSKTVSLNATITLNPLLDATVTVESDQNGSWQLVDANNSGSYGSAGLNLPVTQKYRLRINTNDGRQYLSDFATPQSTPPIDTIGYTLQNGAVNLYLNAHDPTNNARYFLWNYNETWIFHSKFESQFVLDAPSGTIVPRQQSQQVYYCFANAASSHILLNSTAKLKQDVVYQFPITIVPFTSEKIETKYSILVKQYALTGDAYEFYSNIQKNTEQLGSIFDAQPSQLSGNIHNVADATEPVVGYVSVTNAQSKRIFITNAVLPIGTSTSYPYTCEQDSAFYKDKQGYNDVQNLLINQPITDLPTEGLYTPTGVIYGYLYSSIYCTDCTLRGTTQTPSFWK